MSEQIPSSGQPAPAGQPNIFSLLAPYKWLVVFLLVVTVLINALNLIVPRIISGAINSYAADEFVVQRVIIEFVAVALGVLVLAIVQGVIQTYGAERAGRDLRRTFIDKVSRESYATVEDITPARILTNLTADIDSIKTFISMGIPSLVSSLVLIVGASVLLIVTDWKLGLAVIAIVPLIGISFAVIFKHINTLFLKAREVIDWLNRVISESIAGAALVRVLNSERLERDKFTQVNTEAKLNGLGITRLFAALIPIIGFVANLGTLIIVALGGWFVVRGGLSLGDFAAFQAYVVILIFPIISLGFMASMIGQAVASYGRIQDVLSKEYPADTGTITGTIRGEITIDRVSVRYGEKTVLSEVSLSIQPGKKTAIIGPTAAGKTQLLYTVIGLRAPNEGTILFDGRPVADYDKVSLHQHVGFVFQDSVMFNLSIRENIAFGTDVNEQDMMRAIETAELKDFIEGLPHGLDTDVSERGTTLSGGQKQRIMLARALALNPTVLLLDDFTARVDQKTERKILDNIAAQYPNLTLVSVTQKISSVEAYDQIVILMEGEVLGTGTHAELMATSPEYVQIYRSQESTHAYELQA